MPSGIYKRTKINCQNISNALKGENAPMFGKHHTEESKEKNRQKHLGKKQAKEHIENNRQTHLGDKNHNWKGDDVKYRSLHHWVVTNLGQPTKCEHCDKDGLTGKQIHWANKDHKYRRVLDDWIRLCPKCHGKYDKEHGLRKNKSKP